MLLAFTGATVYCDPVSPPVAHASVLVRDERIEAVGPSRSLPLPPDTRRIDGTGLTLCGGFWNSHVHFFERKWAGAAALPEHDLARQVEAMLARFGFTTVFDTASQWVNTRAIRDRIASGEVAGPAIRSTGEGLLPPGGAPSDTVLAMMGVFKVAMPEVATAEEAAAAARARIEAGTDGIKVFVSAPRVDPMPEAAIAAAVQVAHDAGKPAFAHPNTAADVLAAIRAGVDVVAHTTPQSGPWDASLLDEMARRGVALTPTLTLWQHYLRHDCLSTQEKIVDTALGQLGAWRERGGEVLFGTDLGAVEYDPTPEYQLMRAAGMNFAAILESLTTAPARRFGDADAGRIVPGARADLVLVEGDPAADIAALARVRYTVRAGRPIFSRLTPR